MIKRISSHKFRILFNIYASTPMFWAPSEITSRIACCGFLFLTTKCDFIMNLHVPILKPKYIVSHHVNVSVLIKISKKANVFTLIIISSP